jgi:hypothetical protein
MIAVSGKSASSLRSAYDLMQTVTRFWSRVVVNHDDPDGCWLYLGGRNDNGYGVFQFGTRKVYAHRFSFMITHGRRIPDNFVVCHRCDVRQCVNPDHLFLGTTQVNAQDREIKRAVRKLKVIPLSQRPTTREERELRARLMHELAAFNYPQRQIAKHFNVNLKTVQRVLAREAPAAA